MSGKEILAYIKGHYTGTNVQKMICKNPQRRSCEYECIYKFGEILSICTQEKERKRNFGVNQGP